MDEPKQLTWVARIEDMLRGAPPDYARGIRRPTDDDMIGLGELYFETFPHTIVSNLDEAQDELRRTFEGEFGDLDFDASAVIESRDRLVGAVLTVHEAPWDNTPLGPFIIEVMVHPHHRRQHLALRCMITVAARLSSREKETAALRVVSDNEGAKALYRRLGFRPWNRYKKQEEA